MIKTTYFIVLFSFIFMHCSTQKKAQTIEFETIEYYQYGNNQEKEQRLITDAKSFEELYQKVYQDHYPTPEIPTVNFKKNDVIFIHFGEFTHGGIQMELENIYWENNDLMVQIKQVSPNGNSPVASVMTYPFMLIKMDKLDTKPNQIKLIQK